jgi:hypothetical protein
MKLRFRSAAGSLIGPIRQDAAGSERAARWKISVVKHVSLFLLILAGVLVSACHQSKSSTEVPSSATIDEQRYYAVLLTNGAVYFGKLEGLGSPWPVLTNVFYVQAGPVDPNTKQPSGMVLIQRGHELHGPDRMILNEKSIVFVEPVGADSRVAQLIKQAGK